jgi:PhzF family phenazine biosynthesis protein
MEKYIFKKLDVFSKNGSTGNPAGFIMLNNVDDISEENMQKIAFELKNLVSEVGFVFPSDKSGIDFVFRYFSCEKEVPFCGHATVGICYDLLTNNFELRKKESLKLSILENTIIEVENKIDDEDLVYIQAPNPKFLEKIFDPKIVAEVLNVNLENIDQSTPIVIVNVGQNVLLVKLNNKEACINAKPNYEKIRNFALSNDFDAINIYSTDTFYDNDYRTRIFAPGFGYLEDPATGSGNAALGYFLIKQNKWTDSKICIEQGISIKEPNIIVLKKEMNDSIKIGGNSLVKIEGYYFLK